MSRRSVVTGGGSAPGATLQAWGPIADARWKELLAIVEAEDAIQVSGSVNSSGDIRANSPVTASAAVPFSAKTGLKAEAPVPSSPKQRARDKLFGASEKKPVPPSAKTATSGSKLAEAGARKVHRRRPLLILFARHNQQEALGAYRALILAER